MKRVVMVVPAPEGALNPLVLVAASLAGVDEIYRVGGAQAIAALAYGTESIAPVAKIVGPGNAYVAAAKRQVYRPGRHRHGGGPVGGGGDRRQRERPGLDRRRPAGPGRARRGGAVDPDHRRRRLRRARSSGGRDRSFRRLPREATARGELARLWRGDPGRGASTRRPPLADRLAPEHLEIATSGPGSARRADQRCRRDLRRALHAGGDWRLCCRHQPRAAHGAERAIRLGPLAFSIS